MEKSSIKLKNCFLLPMNLVYMWYTLKLDLVYSL